LIKTLYKVRLLNLAQSSLVIDNPQQQILKNVHAAYIWNTTRQRTELV